jgi:hypothetical protein
MLPLQPPLVSDDMYCSSFITLPTLSRYRCSAGGGGVVLRSAVPLKAGSLVNAALSRVMTACCDSVMLLLRSA